MSDLAFAEPVSARVAKSRHVSFVRPNCWNQHRRPPVNTLLGLLVLLAISISDWATAEPQEPKAPETFDLNRIDSYLASQVLEKGRVGLCVAIVKNGELVLAKSYGKRSLQNAMSVEPETMFAIGSVTKQFTCACVLLLAQE